MLSYAPAVIPAQAGIFKIYYLCVAVSNMHLQNQDQASDGLKPSDALHFQLFQSLELWKRFQNLCLAVSNAPNRITNSTRVRSRNTAGQAAR
jgi:hypothetical protein